MTKACSTKVFIKVSFPIFPKLLWTIFFVFFCSESTSIPTQVASSTSGANDKTALLKGFFVNFELLFEWESCLKL